MHSILIILKTTFVFLLATFLAACQSQPNRKGDSAISRVEDCACYKSAEGQKLKPWELAWKEPEKLRKQFSHCICKTYIDIQNVKNPSRYVVPGTVVK